ncbi:MAG: hypothetical protein ACRCZD_13405 [Phycicoccus sp.]
MRPDVVAADGWAQDLRRLSDLAVMAAVVESGSWDDSASVLQREVDDLRAAVERLEGELGGALLHLSGVVLRPTLLGQACVGHARWLRDRVHDLPSTVAGSPVDDLVVAATPGAATEARRLVEVFRERHPEIEVKLVEHHGDRPTRCDASRETDQEADPDVVVLVRGENLGPVAGPQAVRDEIFVCVRHVDRVSRAFVAEVCDPELTEPAYQRARVLAGDTGSGTARRRAQRPATGPEVSTSH